MKKYQYILLFLSIVFVIIILIIPHHRKQQEEKKLFNYNITDISKIHINLQPSTDNSMKQFALYAIPYQYSRERFLWMFQDIGIDGPKHFANNYLFHIFLYSSKWTYKRKIKSSPQLLKDYDLNKCDNYIQFYTIHLKKHQICLGYAADKQTRYVINQENNHYIYLLDEYVIERFLKDESFYLNTKVLPVENKYISKIELEPSNELLQNLQTNNQQLYHYFQKYTKLTFKQNKDKYIIQSLNLKINKIDANNFFNTILNARIENKVATILKKPFLKIYLYSKNMHLITIYLAENYLKTSLNIDNKPYVFVEGSIKKDLYSNLLSRLHFVEEKLK